MTIRTLNWHVTPSILRSSEVSRPHLTPRVCLNYYFAAPWSVPIFLSLATLAQLPVSARPRPFRMQYSIHTIRNDVVGDVYPRIGRRSIHPAASMRAIVQWMKIKLGTARSFPRLVFPARFLSSGHFAIPARSRGKFRISSFIVMDPRYPSLPPPEPWVRCCLAFFTCRSDGS